MKPSIPIRTFLFFTTVLTFLLPSALWAGESVTCRYLQASGKEIRLEITIKTPPPASIIFVQQLPKGIGIKDSSPRLKKFNKKRGEAKWLIKRPKPGTMTVAMTLDSPINTGNISGEVRFKDPQSGHMVSLQVKP